VVALPIVNDSREEVACTPIPVEAAYFNRQAVLPHGVDVEHVRAAMVDFTHFLGVINRQLHGEGIERLESILMPANFSSMVGEFGISALARHAPTIAKNRYHNGHPDIIPKGLYPNDAIQYAHEGIEVKASRYLKGWQGHNAEASWLMVFVFDSNRPADASNGVAPRPFSYLLVAGAQLAAEDWSVAPRGAGSRRTATASVKPSGYEKMMANWIYKVPAVGSVQQILDLQESAS